MHPILASRRHLALYLMAWLPVAALLTVAMMITGWGGWVQSLLFVFPMVVVYAFLCLSAWYPCRAMPLGDQRAEMALLMHIAAAALSALLWVAMAWLLAEGFERSTLYAGRTNLTAPAHWDHLCCRIAALSAFGRDPLPVCCGGSLPRGGAASSRS